MRAAFAGDDMRAGMRQDLVRPARHQDKVAVTLHMVPEGMKTAAFLCQAAPATRSHSRLTVGSSPDLLVADVGPRMASRIAGVGTCLGCPTTG